MRNFFTNFGLLVATVVLFFGGIEAALRMTGLQTTKPNPPKIFQKSVDPKISYELKPGIQERAYRSTVTTNEQGFRITTHSSAHLSPHPFIVFLGDSITFGYGLEDDEAIPARIQKALPQYTIINTAVPGYNLKQQTAVYRKKIASLMPEALVLIFHPNDLEDIGTGWLDDQGIIRPEGWKPETETCTPITTGILNFLPGKCWFDQHSAFYRAIEKFINLQQRKKDLKTTQEQSRGSLFDDDVTDAQLTTYARDLDQLVALLPPKLPRLFVIWPDRRVYFVSRPKLLKIAENHGFKTLDLYQIFGNQAETLSWDTVHPSTKTASEGAEAIHAALEHYELVH